MGEVMICSDAGRWEFTSAGGGENMASSSHASKWEHYLTFQQIFKKVFR